MVWTPKSKPETRHSKNVVHGVDGSARSWCGAIDAQHSQFPSRVEVAMERAAAHLMTWQDNLPKRTAVKVIGSAGLLSLHAKTNGTDQQMWNFKKCDPQGQLKSLLCEIIWKKDNQPLSKRGWHHQKRNRRWPMAWKRVSLNGITELMKASSISRPCNTWLFPEITVGPNQLSGSIHKSPKGWSESTSRTR